MLTETDAIVTFTRDTWEELKVDDYYKEVIDAIEDRESLKQAQKETEYFVELD